MIKPKKFEKFSTELLTRAFSGIYLFINKKHISLKIQELNLAFEKLLLTRRNLFVILATSKTFKISESFLIAIFIN